MEVDLIEIEAKLKRMLEQLDARKVQLKEEFQALERQHPSAAVDTSNTAVSTQEDSRLESPSPGFMGGSPAEPADTQERTLHFQDDPSPTQGPTQPEAVVETTPPGEVPVAQGEGLDNTLPAMEKASEKLSASELAPPNPIPAPSAPEKDARSLKEQIAGSSVEEAVLAALKALETRLKPAKIAEELLAAGYPFPGDNPRDLVMNVLPDMARDNKIRQMKTIKGTYFTLL